MNPTKQKASQQHLSPCVSYKITNVNIVEPLDSLKEQRKCAHLIIPT